MLNDQTLMGLVLEKLNVPVMTILSVIQVQSQRYDSLQMMNILSPDCLRHW